MKSEEIKDLESNTSTSQTKAQKLRELCELFDELYALKEKEGVRKGD